MKGSKAAVALLALAFVELAALVADDFPDAAGRHHGPRRPRD